MLGKLAHMISAFNVGVSFFIWVPSWIKVLKTKSSSDFSVPSFLLILWLQISNFCVSLVERAWGMVAYCGVNSLTVLAMVLLILKYRTKNSPLRPGF